MTRTILSTSIAMLVCAAGLGSATKGKVDQKIRELAAARTSLHATEGALKAKAHDLESTNERLALSRQETEDKAAALAQRDEKARAALKEVATLGEAMKSRDEAVAKLQSDLIASNQKLDAAMADAKLQLALAQKQLDESKANGEADRSRLRAAEERLALRHREGNRPENKPLNPLALSGSVLAVNQPLNFVILSLGDDQGVTSATPLLVMRGNQRIATLKISSVEPRGSIADVVPGSLARGQAVQAGDKVVFPGTRGQVEVPIPVEAPALTPESGAPASGNLTPPAESRPTA